MSRQQLLFKLLEKAEKNNQYVYSQYCQISQSPSVPAVKRMQILPMGFCKINAPSPKAKQEHLYQKHNNVSNRRVFVLQKMKPTPKQADSERNRIAQKLHQLVQQQSIYHNIINQPSQKRMIQNFKTQAQSPLKNHRNFKKTISLSENFKNNQQLSKETSQIFKSEKHSTIRSKQLSISNSLKGESQKKFQRKLSNTSRINKINQGSFQNKQEQRRVKIELRKQINKNYQKALTPPPKLTAKSFIVYEIIQSENHLKPAIKIHTAYNSKIRVQIASLTKIMTCIVIIEICERFSIHSRGEEIKIGKFQTSIGGTSAHIQPNDVYTVHDLLHGLMLPSGNDASIALAVWGGKKLFQNKQLVQGLPPSKKMKKQCYNRFIQQMNAKALAIGLTKTTYANSHGLINLLNRSCAHDVAILSHYCMKNQYFCKIVSCQKYDNLIKVQTKILIENKEASTKIIYPKVFINQENQQDQQLSEMQSEVCQEEKQPIFEEKIVLTNREISWENTHKLLHKNPKQYLGIKTGVTTTAGPCLSSCVITPCGRKLFIVVLNCKKLQMRFKETEVLKKWVYKKEGIVRKEISSYGSKSTKSQMGNSEKQCSEMDQMELGETLSPFDC